MEGKPGGIPEPTPEDPWKGPLGAVPLEGPLERTTGADICRRPLEGNSEKDHWR